MGKAQPTPEQDNAVEKLFKQLSTTLQKEFDKITPPSENYSRNSGFVSRHINRHDGAESTYTVIRLTIKDYTHEQIRLEEIGLKEIKFNNN